MVEINLCDAVYSREGKGKEEGSWGVSSIGERLRRRGVCGRLRRGISQKAEFATGMIV